MEQHFLSYIPASAVEYVSLKFWPGIGYYYPHLLHIYGLRYNYTLQCTLYRDFDCRTLNAAIFNVGANNNTWSVNLKPLEQREKSVSWPLRFCIFLYFCPYFV